MIQPEGKFGELPDYGKCKQLKFIKDLSFFRNLT